MLTRFCTRLCTQSPASLILSLLFRGCNSIRVKELRNMTWVLLLVCHEVISFTTQSQFFAGYSRTTWKYYSRSARHRGSKFVLQRCLLGTPPSSCAWCAVCYHKTNKGFNHHQSAWPARETILQ